MNGGSKDPPHVQITRPTYRSSAPITDRSPHVRARPAYDRARRRNCGLGLRRMWSAAGGATAGCDRLARRRHGMRVAP